jgi:hypothetical protein
MSNISKDSSGACQFPVSTKAINHPYYHSPMTTLELVLRVAVLMMRGVLTVVSHLLYREPADGLDEIDTEQLSTAMGKTLRLC